MLADALPDREIVRRWLTAALEVDGKPAAGRRSALAKHCGVTSQAVSGWLKTGRIGKGKLELAAQFLGHGPSFTHAGSHARAPAAAPYRAERPGPPAAPAPDFHETRAPSESEWQLLHDLAVYPSEERQKLLAAVHAEADRWRHIEHELVQRIKAKATPR